MFAFYHFSAVFTIKKSSRGVFVFFFPSGRFHLLCILHNFFFVFFIYLEILTITLHIVHNLFIFYGYNNHIDKQAKCRVVNTHIDKFFHNSPGAERCLGTPHFTRINRAGNSPAPSFLFKQTHRKSIPAKTASFHPFL